MTGEEYVESLGALGPHTDADVARAFDMGKDEIKEELSLHCATCRRPLAKGGWESIEGVRYDRWLCERHGVALYVRRTD